MDIISRLKQYMEISKISSSQLADAAGIPRPTLSQLLNGRNKSNEGAKKVSSDIIKKIHEAFPALNVLWLLFGDGQMEIASNIQISEAENADCRCTNGNEQADGEPFQRQLDFDNSSPNLRPNNFATAQSEEIAPDNPKRPIFDAQSIQSMYPNTGSSNSMPKQCKKTKCVESIMVFYSDNSFEIYKPAN